MNLARLTSTTFLMVSASLTIRELTAGTDESFTSARIRRHASKPETIWSSSSPMLSDNLRRLEMSRQSDQAVLPYIRANCRRFS